MSDAYDIWLSLSLGAASQKPAELAELFGTSEQVYRAGEREWRMCGFLTPKNTAKMSLVKIDDAEKIIEECDKSGIIPVSFYEDLFPPRLKEIPDRPYMLYFKGNIELLKSRRLFCALVGTRNPGDYGRSCAEALSRGLSANGAVIVSGGAKGIDSVSHRGALSVNGETVCVLGCGINYPYLPENEGMRREISENGVLVSEYPPSAAPTKYSFIVRNRLISGLSDATVVIEAGKTSGALATANYCREQKRMLFAVAGGMFSESFEGSNGLLKSGANAVFSAEEVFEKTGFKPSLSANNKSVSRENIKTKSRNISFEKPEMPEGLSKKAKLIYESFNFDEMSLLQISSKVKASPGELLAAISELEIRGIITALGGSKYRFIYRKQV